MDRTAVDPSDLRHTGAGTPATGFLTRLIVGLLAVDLLLGIAHLLWPYYVWGQGRQSYFHFGNQLTAASWLVSMELVATAVLALAAFHRDRRRLRAGGGSWVWLLGAALLLALSVGEMTRLHERLGLLGFPERNVYQQLVVLPAALGVLLVFGWQLLDRLRDSPRFRRFAVGWVIAWSAHLAVVAVSQAAPAGWEEWRALLGGLTYLLGVTFLLGAVGGYALRPMAELPRRRSPAWQAAPFSARWGRSWMLAGAGGTALILIYLQIVLFGLLTSFSDYLTANSIISIALLGGAVGGLVGFATAGLAPVATVVRTALLLPASILVAFGTAVTLMDTPVVASILLMAPFICAGTITAVVLARMDSHLAYFVILVGAGLGALSVDPVLTRFREEGALLLAGSLGFAVAAGFAVTHHERSTRRRLMALAGSGAVILLATAVLNVRYDWLNVTAARVRETYPAAQVLFSRSSLIGRYDIVRREPDDRSLKAYENGRTSDTIRPYPVTEHQIDPRIPHTLFDDPVVLIVGTSGDAITKSASFLSTQVYGVEINPAVVGLQSNELVAWNADSYREIDVTVMDGRSYVEQFGGRVDIITLLNTHFARGPTRGRVPSPEYLFTTEAIHAYLDHLTDDGVLILEEPVARPDREPPVWKALLTMRAVLLERGSERPEDHFFVFQWRTDSNNYLQVVMKRSPFSDDDVERLRRWVEDVDRIRDLEALAGQRLGPIRTATTTVLHSPGEAHESNVSRIVRGTAPGHLLHAYNLQPLRDDRPFLFDVDPARPALTAAYGTVLLLVALFALLLVRPLARSHTALARSLPHLLAVALTGVGYLLVETVLIQRYTLFLGSPVATFSSVLGTLLIFSGLGSLWSRRLQATGIYRSLVLVVLLLTVHQFAVPALFPLGASLTLPVKVAATVLSLAPLAFLLGFPFPYVLRSGKAVISESAAALLFGVNAATSALAVPLALTMSAAWGFRAAFLAAVVIYVMVAVLLAAIHAPPVRAAAGWSGVLLTVAVLVSPWLPAAAAASAAPDGLAEIHAVSYGRSEFQESQAFLGGSSTGSVPFEWLFWVIEIDERTILVDTGFADPALANAWGVRDHTHPLQRLHQLGIAPGDVDDVILTHAHWDHIGTLASFGEARVWLQRAEFDHAAALLDEGASSAGGMYWKDLGALLVAEAEGRLRLVDGEAIVTPGVRVSHTGGHTPGSQVVIVETRDGPVIIAGDETYLYRNNQSHRAVGSAYDHAANLTAIRGMHRRAASPFLILPGHDPRVTLYFPPAAEGIVRITLGD